MSGIEVGDYVRTKNGEIHKVIEIKENRYITNFADYFYYRYDNNMGDFKSNIANHSKQLIDLIEVGDIIKYRINNISTTLETKGYIEGIIGISDEEMLQEIKSDKDYHILEILTKESYIANCYKVGGENEI